MATITLFHGSPYKSVTPEYGLGNDKHDYGRGFYLTANVELAKEWAVCRPDESNGWVHQYELDTDGLRILDFQEHSVLTWLAELMKREVPDGLLSVSYSEFNDKYNQRDVEARQNMRDLIDSDANTVTNVFSTLL